MRTFVIWLGLFLAICISVTSPALAADDDNPLYTHVSNWSIYTDTVHGNCRSLRVYDDDTMLAFTYDIADDNMLMMIGSNLWSSVVTRQEYTLDLIFLNVNTETIDEGWTNRKAVGFNDSGRGLLGMKFPRQTLEKDVVINTGLVVKRSNIVIAAYSLVGTSAMMTSLGQCAKEAWYTYRGDPFTK